MASSCWWEEQPFSSFLSDPSQGWTSLAALLEGWGTYSLPVPTWQIPVKYKRELGSKKKDSQKLWLQWKALHMSELSLLTLQGAGRKHLCQVLPMYILFNLCRNMMYPASFRKSVQGFLNKILWECFSPAIDWGWVTETLCPLPPVTGVSWMGAFVDQMLKLQHSTANSKSHYLAITKNDRTLRFAAVLSIPLDSISVCLDNNSLKWICTE